VHSGKCLRDRFLKTLSEAVFCYFLDNNDGPALTSPCILTSEYILGYRLPSTQADAQVTTQGPATFRLSAAVPLRVFTFAFLLNLNQLRLEQNTETAFTIGCICFLPATSWIWRRLKHVLLMVISVDDLFME
jgi:hypothetical protein